MKRTQPWVVAAALVLLLPLFPFLVPDAEAATTTKVLTITQASAQPRVAWKGFDGNPPKAFDINGDGKMEILAQNDNQYLYIFDSTTGTILAELTTPLPSGWGARTFNGPEASIMNDGGTARVIVVNSAAHVTMFRYDAAASTATKFVFAKEWDKRMSSGANPNYCHSNPGSDSKPVLADLDKDGSLEIIVTTEERGVYALRKNGAPYWHNCLGGGNAEATVADINLDGKLDVIHVSDGGLVAALNGQTGGWMWSFNVLSKFDLGSGSIPVGAAVGQLDGTGGLEIVFGARDSHDPDNWANDHAALVALNSAGQMLWGRRHAQGTPLTYTHPIITDADNNGNAEVYWGDWNTVGHKPPWPGDATPAWKTQGAAHAYRYDKAGTLVWRTPLNSWWHNKDFAIADVDDDGRQEVIANGPCPSGSDGIWYIDVVTGVKETCVSMGGFSVARGAIVEDLYGRGTMQWIVEVGKPDGILVFDTGAPWDAKWPHLPYVTKSRGTEPTPTTTTPSPTTTTPNPGNTFGATFTLKSPNPYWQQLAVQPDTARTIQVAHIRVNGGTWQAMTFRSTWGPSGEFTSGYNIPAGSRVEFRATDSSAATSTSLPFTWLDGTLTKRSAGGGGSTPFTASFSPVAVGNNWWVEVKVTASHPLRGVDAQVNSGAWTPLTYRAEYGQWAKSINAPDGSQVRFRATSATTGETVTSTSYTWP